MMGTVCGLGGESLRGPKPHYPITLTDDTAAHLRQLMRAHSTPQAQVLRARIVLTAFEQPDWSNDLIAQTLGTSDRMVRKWRRRWVETHSLEPSRTGSAPGRPACTGAGVGRNAWALVGQRADSALAPPHVATYSRPG